MYLKMTVSNMSDLVALQCITINHIIKCVNIKINYYKNHYIKIYFIKITKNLFTTLGRGGYNESSVLPTKITFVER